MFVCILCLCCPVCRQRTLLPADPPSKEPYACRIRKLEEGSRPNKRAVEPNKENVHR
jgi:hypothetical protein